MSVNKVILIGNVGKDPEVRDANGTAVASLTLATSEKFKGRDGQTKETTEWHRVVLWDRLAGVVEQYVTKGSQIYIEGKLTTRKFTDRDGNEKYITEIRAERLQLLGGKSESRPEPRQQPRQQTRQQPREEAFEDEEIPF